MSFIMNEATSKVYAPGWFLAYDDEGCVRETRTIPQSMATTEANGTKYVKMGTPFPANNNTAVGIVYEDVDVTSGSMPGSVVTKGIVYEDRLPVEINSNAKSALAALGFVFIESSPSVTRPDWTSGGTTGGTTGGT